MRRHWVEHGRLLWTTVGCGCSRQWYSWGVPSKTVQPMSLERTAGGVPAACFGVRSRVRWLLERALPWHSDSSNGGRTRNRESEGRSIRRTGMEQFCCDTEPGSMQSREHSRSTQNHVCSEMLPRRAAHAAGSRLVILRSRRVAEPAERGGSDGWGVASSKEGAAQ